MTTLPNTPRTEQRIADILVLTQYAKEQLAKQQHITEKQQNLLGSIGENTYSMVKSLETMKQALSTEQLVETLTGNASQIENYVTTLQESLTTLVSTTTDGRTETAEMVNTIAEYHKRQLEQHDKNTAAVQSLSESNIEQFASMSKTVDTLMTTMDHLYKELSNDGPLKGTWQVIETSLKQIDEKQNEYNQSFDEKMLELSKVTEDITRGLTVITGMSQMLDENLQLTLGRLDVIDVKVNSIVPAEVKGNE